MIVPMKKVTVLCLAADTDATLEHLRELGALHLAPIRPPENADVEAARQELIRRQRALDVLPARAGRAPGSGNTPAEITGAIWDLLHEKKSLEDEMETLRHEQTRLAPFGDFDPAAIRALAKKGIHVKLCQTVPDARLDAPADAVLTVLARTKSAVYLVVVRRGEPVVLGQEVWLPEIGPAAIRARIADYETRVAANARALETHSGDRPALAAYCAEAEDRLRLLQARAGMGAAAQVVYLRGYCPADHAACLREAARDGGWGLLVEEPGNGDTDSVPTLIRNPAWVRPIKLVFAFVGIVPGYREVDISAIFLLFFSLFFAMLVGDAGYGAIFLGLTCWGRRRWRNAPSTPFRLLYILSGATMVWGVLTGTYFGLARLPAPLARLKVNWLTDPATGEQNLMLLCFLIGAVQLSLAHLWNIWRQRRSLQALAQLGWLATTWTMFFAARTMVLNRPFPPVMMSALIAGVALIVLFMTPWRQLKAEWFNHVMLPLNLVSNFVDVVSYIRLFAVGSASFAVAAAFNEMAFGRMNGVVGGLVGALILFGGHALNLALSAMGVLVHGIRLNTLEFSGHLGMQWTGVPFAPFARKEKSARLLAEMEK